MKLSVASLALAAALSSVEAVEVEEKNLRVSETERNLLFWRGGRVRESDLIGDCSQLNGASFTFDTHYFATEEIAYTYPCSGGYLKNFAANNNLLEGVRDAINHKGRNEFGINADCANLCDINNGSYNTDSVSGAFSIEQKFGSNADIFCDIDNGVFNDESLDIDVDFQKGPNGENACRCDPEGGYLLGCWKCFGTITFTVDKCIDSTNAPTGNSGGWWSF